MNGHDGGLPQGSPHGSPHSGLDSFFAFLRRPGIIRVSEGKWFAGVAAGLARSLGVDPLVVRAAFIFFSLFFGMGIALYLLLWLLLPAEDGSLSIEKALRHGDGGSIFLLIVTVIAVFGGGGPGWRDQWTGLRVLGFIAMGAVVWWVLSRHQAQTPGPPPGWAPGSTPSPAPSAETGAEQPSTTVAGMATPPSGWVPPAAPAPARWEATPVAPVPRPPLSPRPITPVLGFAAGAIVLGAALVAGALTTSVADRLGWSGNHVSLGLAAALAVIGVGALVAGLSGRRTGWIAPFAILGIIATLFSSVSPAGLRHPWRVGDNTVSPTTIQGAGPYELGAGQLDLDLSEATLDNDPATVQTVQARVGAGDLRLVVPAGTSVRVHATARAGGLTAFESNESPDSTLEAGGIDFERTIDYGTGPIQLVVEAEVGVGQITIRKG
jgi:phage shock protein PspC (stress-responsive transcriptional regulator)